MESFGELKKNNKRSIEDLTKELDSLKTSGFQEDKRFYYPDLDKVGIGSATIRFLPPPKGEDNRFVKIFHHGFKGPGGQWYIENSLTTIGQNDPVSEYNSKLWNTGLDANKKIASGQKRKTKFISNIVVVKDEKHPEFEGKNFLFRYGKKIFDKLNEAAFPEFPDTPAFDPFSLWEGANFKLKIRKVEGWPNYDKSEFDDVGPYDEDDKVLEKLWSGEFSLQAFLAASEFKSYDELKKKFYRVIGSQASTEDAQEVDEPSIPSAVAKALDSAAPEGKEDNLDYFNNMLNDDE